jgi:hypothetical protein
MIVRSVGPAILALISARSALSSSDMMRDELARIITSLVLEKGLGRSERFEMDWHGCWADDD